MGYGGAPRCGPPGGSARVLEARSVRGGGGGLALAPLLICRHLRGSSLLRAAGVKFCVSVVSWEESSWFVLLFSSSSFMLL